MFFVHTKNVQTIQYLYNQLTETTFVCFFGRTHNVQTIQNLYNQLTETVFVCFFVHKHNVQAMQNLFNQLIETAFVCFCTYTQCANYTKCIQMLIQSYMWLPIYVFCIYKNPKFFTFQTFASTMPSSILVRNFIKFQD